LQHVSSQKDLGVTVCSDLRWNTHIYEQVTKANRLLGMLKVKNVNTRRCLYLAYTCEIPSCLCLTSVVSTDYHHVYGARTHTT
jgi:hypothetical protein